MCNNPREECTVLLMKANRLEKENEKLKKDLQVLKKRIDEFTYLSSEPHNET